MTRFIEIFRRGRPTDCPLKACGAVIVLHTSLLLGINF